MSIEYQGKGLIELYRPKDLIQFDVHINEMKVGRVEKVSSELKVGYLCLWEVSRIKNRKIGNKLEWDENMKPGNMMFYASCARYHKTNWVPPLLEKCWEELNAE